MYSQRNASGEQLDVHFCTCRARCRTSKLPAAQTTGCLECVKGKPAVDDKLGNEVMNLLMSLRAPRQALGGVAGVWGVPPTSSSNPPTPPHSLPIPHPETPQLNKVPQVTPILVAWLLLGEEETKETKILGGRPPDRELNLHIKLQDERTRRVRHFSWQTFDTFLVC